MGGHVEENTEVGNPLLPKGDGVLPWIILKAVC